MTQAARGSGRQERWDQASARVEAHGWDRRVSDPPMARTGAEGYRRVQTSNDSHGSLPTRMFNQACCSPHSVFKSVAPACLLYPSARPRSRRRTGAPARAVRAARVRERACRPHHPEQPARTGCLWTPGNERSWTVARDGVSGDWGAARTLKEDSLGMSRESLPSAECRREYLWQRVLRRCA
jgi:hypothetical protein